MNEHKFILKRTSQIIYSGEKIILHDKIKDKYYSFIRESHFILMSLNSVYSIKRIINDTEAYFKIPRNIAEFFVINFLKDLLEKDLIEEVLWAQYI